MIREWNIESYLEREQRNQLGGRKDQAAEQKNRTSKAKKIKQGMAGLLAAAMVLTSLAGGGYALGAKSPVYALDAATAKSVATTELKPTSTLYAATTTTPATTTPTPAAIKTAVTTFGGETIKLSLAQAVTRMQTLGSDAETALLNKQSDESIARGYKETVSAYYDAQSTKQIESKVAALRKEFALSQTDGNYKAELNSIEAKTVELYYGLLLAEENLKVTKDNLTNQKAIYNNTLKKFKLGTVAKIDTLTAQTAVLKAENEVAKAESDLAAAKMNFNLLLGYDLMQQVTLTDTLKQVAAPKGNLTEWIDAAVKNRNEIKGTVFGANVLNVILENMKLTTNQSSSTYCKQKVAYLEAKKAADDAPAQIEMDIRVQVMGLANKAKAIETAKATLANAKEGYRLALITYDAGMNTLTDVQEAQITSFQAGQAMNAAISDYDVAVSQFGHAIGAGTTRISI